MPLIEPKLEDLPLLMDMLGEPTAKYREDAARSIARLGPKARKAVPILAKLVDDDDQQEVREAAVQALSSIGREAKAAVPALLRALKDDFRPVRLAVLHALVRIAPASPEASAAITETMVDADEEVRVAAAAILHRMVG